MTEDDALKVYKDARHRETLAFALASQASDAVEVEAYGDALNAASRAVVVALEGIIAAKLDAMGRR